MALTSRQRSALPNSAFVYPTTRKYPVPTRAQAARAGISEAQRQRTHRNALGRAGQRATTGSYFKVARTVKTRGAGIATIHGRRGTTSHAGMRRR
jgi:hypothetical protein